MSTKDQNKFCQKLVAFISQELAPWHEQIIKNRLAGGNDLKLTSAQLSVVAAAWDDLQSRKIIITDTAGAASHRLWEMVRGWNEVLGVNKNWHFLAGQLTEQEMKGHVVTTLSRGFSALLRSNPHDHFIIPATVLDNPVPDPAAYAKKILQLTVGEQYSPGRLSRELTQRGYSRHHATVEPGAFSVRGENILVVDPYDRTQSTVTLWRNTIERITKAEGTRAQPASAVKIPPIGFPEPSANWSEVLKESCVFRPAHRQDANGARTVIYDALRPQLEFPLADCSRENVHLSGKKVFVLY